MLRRRHHGRASAGTVAGARVSIGGARVWTTGAMVAAAALAVGQAGASPAPAAPASAFSGVASPSCGPVEYGGSGSPAAVVVSDLPMVGGSQERSRQMVAAIRLVLADRAWRAGPTPVGYQACNDALASTGAWDPAQCTANAGAYAGNPSVLGVVGTYNSGCAALIIPVLNRSATAMVSPGNTLVCLTLASPGCPAGQPRGLYPSGRRTYARVVPNDAYQGAGLATFARRRRVRRPFVLYAAKDPTSLGQARTFRGASRALGARVVGFRAWDPKARGYRRLLRGVKRRHPDAVVLAGLIEENGGRLIRDKVAVLGPNAGPVRLLAPDGFAQQSTIKLAGRAARGMFVSLPGRDPAHLTGAGRTLERRLARQVAPRPVEPFAPYAGQALGVLLDAVARGGGSRAGAASALLGVRVRHGILGSFGFLASGDPTVGPISVYRAAGTLRFAAEVVPQRRVVSAARAGR
ncbi:MAG: hypothetical protein E6G56_11965 [Actinobacteria bacterium]|nr:MAG: hypothetical protein E6G56_11965 [Actinomycetota bacterium]